MTEKLFPLLILKSDGLEGYGEGVMDPLPDFLEESIPSAMNLMREVLLPAVVGHSFANPEALAPLMTPWRGHQMTKATLEMAFWDLWAKSLDLPLKTALGGAGEAIPVGVSLGIGPIEKPVDVLPAIQQGIAAVRGGGACVIDMRVLPGYDTRA